VKAVAAMTMTMAAVAAVVVATTMTVGAAVVAWGGAPPCDDIFDCPLTPGGRQRRHFAGLMCTVICCSFPL